MSQKSKNVKIFVNILSILRVVMIPVLYFIPEGIPLFIVCNLLFITDFFDGYLARQYDATSKMGATLDLIGDKALVVYLMLWALYTDRLGIVIVFLVILREVLSLVLRYFKNKNEGKAIPASIFGKAKTATQFIAFDMLLLMIPGYKIAFIIAIILGYYSLYTYVQVYRGRD